MGERFRRLQAERFKHQTSAAYDRLKVPTLLTNARQDVLTPEYTCELDGDHRPSVGASVVLQRQNESVVVLQGNRRVATVEASDAGVLHEAIDIGAGMLRARVEAHSDVGGFFTVRLVEGE